MININTKIYVDNMNLDVSILCFYDNEYTRKENEKLWEIYVIFSKDEDEHENSPEQILVLNADLGQGMSEAISKIYEIAENYNK